MARVTVEDCVDKVPNRFDLVMLAAHRSRGISAGAPLTVDRDNDRNPVVALREIADESISLEEVGDSLIRSLQRHVEVDEPEEEDTLEMMAGAIMAGEDGEAGAPAGETVRAMPDEGAVAMPDFSSENVTDDLDEAPETAVEPEDDAAEGPEKSE